MVNTYQHSVATADVHQDLKASLKYNERVPGFLTNLYRELKKVPKIETQDVEDITRSLTLTFLNAVEQKAKEAMLSDAEKNRLITEEQDAAQLKKGADELLETGTISEETLHVLSKEE